MPARDKYHDEVKSALIKDGWTITHDPYVISYEEVTVYGDLGAERLVAAERGSRKIVVKIKSFIKRSPRVSYEDIVLAFCEPELRKMTEFAVA